MSFSSTLFGMTPFIEKLKLNEVDWISILPYNLSDENREALYSALENNTSVRTVEFDNYKVETKYDFIVPQFKELNRILSKNKVEKLFFRRCDPELLLACFEEIGGTWMKNDHLRRLEIYPEDCGKEKYYSEKMLSILSNFIMHKPNLTSVAISGKIDKKTFDTLVLATNANPTIDTVKFSGLDDTLDEASWTVLLNSGRHYEKLYLDMEEKAYPIFFKVLSTLSVSPTSVFEFSRTLKDKEIVCLSNILATLPTRDEIQSCSIEMYNVEDEGLKSIAKALRENPRLLFNYGISYSDKPTAEGTNALGNAFMLIFESLKKQKEEIFSSLKPSYADIDRFLHHSIIFRINFHVFGSGILTKKPPTNAQVIEFLSKDVNYNSACELEIESWLDKIDDYLMQQQANEKLTYALLSHRFRFDHILFDRDLVPLIGQYAKNDYRDDFIHLYSAIRHLSTDKDVIKKKPLEAPVCPESEMLMQPLEISDQAANRPESELTKRANSSSM